MSEFPLCQLHDTRIVTEFPEGCALAMNGEAASKRLLEMRKQSYWPGQGDPAPYSAMAHAYDVCMACQSTLRTNQLVQFLRSKGGSDA